MNPQQSNDIIKQIVRQETIDKVPEGFSTRLMERLHASETIKNNHVPFFTGGLLWRWPLYLAVYFS